MIKICRLHGPQVKFISVIIILLCKMQLVKLSCYAWISPESAVINERTNVATNDLVIHFPSVTVRGDRNVRISLSKLSQDPNETCTFVFGWLAEVNQSTNKFTCENVPKDITFSPSVSFLRMFNIYPESAITSDFCGIRRWYSNHPLLYVLWHLSDSQKHGQAFSSNY